METALRKTLPHGRFSDVSRLTSRTMAAVRSRHNKTTETSLRLAMVRARLHGWNMHPPGLPGHPDFFFPRRRLVVFVDGCFWHGCPECGHIPWAHSRFWKAKILRNTQRDHQTSRILRSSGFIVLRFWEHDLNHNLPKCIRNIKMRIDKPRP